MVYSSLYCDHCHALQKAVSWDNQRDSFICLAYLWTHWWYMFWKPLFIYIFSLCFSGKRVNITVTFCFPKQKWSEVTQLCPTLCDPMDCSLGSSLHGILWSGLPFPSPGDLPDPGIEPGSAMFQADSNLWATREAPKQKTYWISNIKVRGIIETHKPYI